MDIFLDRTTHDLDFKAYNLHMVDGVDLIIQRIKQRLLLYLGEWFLDTTAGVPYFTEILIKGVALQTVEGILQKTIVETDGVVRITSFLLDYDSTSRSLVINFSAETIYGNIKEQQVVGGL